MITSFKKRIETPLRKNTINSVNSRKTARKFTPETYAIQAQIALRFLYATCQKITNSSTNEIVK